MERTKLERILLAIGVATMASGAFQAVAPERLLRLLSANDDETDRTLFATIGMFMVVTGGTLVHGLLTPVRQPVIVLWGAAQKLGASAAVTIGVCRGVFSPLALLVAAFDLLSGALAAIHWTRIRKS